MRRIGRIGQIVTALVLATGAQAAAQGHGGAYAFGGIAGTRQDGPTGESYHTYVTAPGGAATGWLVGAGVFAAPFVSVEFEISSTGIMAAREPSRYGMTFNEERRDRFFTGAVRFHLPIGSVVDLEPVGGFTVVRGESWSQTESFMFWLTPQQQLVVEPRHANPASTRFGLVGGVDARIGRGHLAVVPSLRFFDTGDGAAGRPYYPSGFPTVTLRIGAMIRVGF
jgi:hypothetical protein